MKKYILQESSEHPYGWVLTDPELGIIVTFEEGKFNETQKFRALEDIPEQFKGLSPEELLRATNDAVASMVDWLRENHPEIIFTSPKRIKQRARKQIGETIKALREDSGETQRDLAKAIGIGQGHLARIENGQYSVGIDILAMIADHFGLELDFCD